jgi:cytochrome c553
MKLNILLFSALLISNLSYSATPEEQAEAKKQLLVDRVKKILKDPNKYQSAMIEARDRVVFCSNCHGEDGNSSQPGIPRLAGQNAVYLLDQIEKFAKKERKQFVMNELAKNFTDHEKTILAVYYSNNKVIPASGDIEKAKQAALDANQSPAIWLLREIPLRIMSGDTQTASDLMQTIEANHIEEPGIREHFYQLLMQLGIINPDG